MRERERERERESSLTEWVEQNQHRFDRININVIWFSFCAV